MARGQVAPPQIAKFLREALPDFELERALGQGGMGLVVLGTQKTLKRQVAVKLLFVEKVDESYVARFRREAKMYASLAHPNLVKIYDAQVEGETPFLTLEYIRGKDLKEAILASEVTLQTVMAPLASALAYVHERGILHRDIKPANVMLREGGQPVLMDFGLAKAVDPNATALTEDGMRIGTPYYMPPEVLLGKGASDAAGDVYCLGLVLYEVAVGHTMSQLDALGHGPIQRVTRGLPPIGEFNPALPDALVELVTACITLDPKARPTALELVSRLSGLAAGGTISGFAMPAPDAGPATLVEGATGRASGRVRRSSALSATPVGGIRRDSSVGSGVSGPDRRVLAALAFALVTVATLIGLVALRPRPPVPAATPSALAVTEPSPSPATLAPERTGRDGQTFVLVPAGWFTMGAQTPEFPDEMPPHRIHLDAFYIARTEVTNALYDKFCKETRHRAREGYARHSPDFDAPDHPVVGVTWEDAQAYCAWAGQRLPTEAEWEKAARGDDARLFPWGKAPPSNGQLANFSDNSATADLFGDDLGKAAKFQGSDGFVYTAPVGHYPKGASPFGLLDMAGNVQELVADFYDPKYYASSPSKSPVGPATGQARVARGGCYDNIERSIRTAKREAVPLGSRSNRVGFRTALSP